MWSESYARLIPTVKSRPTSRSDGRWRPITDTSPTAVESFEERLVYGAGDEPVGGGMTLAPREVEELGRFCFAIMEIEKLRIKSRHGGNGENNSLSPEFRL
jgi:hypothetical protein